MHIPKNAGTTIRKLFNPKKLIWEDHACLQHIHNEIGSEVFYQTKFIAICRDPMERLYSWWSYHKTHQNYPPNFNNWVEIGCPHHWLTSEYFIQQYGLEYSAYLYAPTNQSNFLKVDGKFPDNLSIYHQESLHDSWKDIARNLGKPEITMQNFNKSTKEKAWRKTITEETKSKIFRLCQEDYQNFYP